MHPPAPEPTLERVQAVRRRLGLRFDAVVVSVGGTNGKGSSCAMLESIMRAAGWRVGLYGSPHLIRFEERCRIDGRPIDAAALLPHFAAVEQAREGVALTYFEFTTLAILRALAAAPLDLVVLEVGLGGRLDAVNAVDADCALLTSIDLDHCAILGPDRDSIGREKATSCAPAGPRWWPTPIRRRACRPMPRRSAPTCGSPGAISLSAAATGCNGGGAVGSSAGTGSRIRRCAAPISCSTPAACLRCWRHWPRACRSTRRRCGRAWRASICRAASRWCRGSRRWCSTSRHNPQAAAVLARNLDQMSLPRRTHAVFGAMADKDIAGMLRHLLPLVQHWYLCDLPLPRAAGAAEIEAVLRRAAGAAPVESRHPSPEQALAAALAAADPVDRIVVFGSFLTVGGVLKAGTAHWRSGR